MKSVSTRQAKALFFQLIDGIESGREQEIIITRNGKPVARLVPIDTPSEERQKVGIAKGVFEVSDLIDAHNPDVKG